MYVQYHFTFDKSHHCIWMCCAVIQGLDDAVECVFSGLGLGGGKRVERYEQCVVHCSGIVQQYTDYLLDEKLEVGGKWGRGVRVFGELCLRSVRRCKPCMW